jgi:hypothetical protein
MSYECFADEIAIDFPSVVPAVERMRDAFFGERESDGVLRRDVQLSPREAWEGATLPIDVPIVTLCRACGGRGECWTDPCRECGATGERVRHHTVRVALPPGLADGVSVRFRVSSPGAEPVRVEVRITLASRVIE